MRICVLLSSREDDQSDTAGLDPEYVPGLWLKDHEVQTVTLHKKGATEAVSGLAEQGFDVFLNLCEGTWFEDVAGVEVVEALERLGVPFTGPSSRLYALSKEAMKEAAVRLGILTPDYAFVSRLDQLDRAVSLPAFPIIVKHFDGGGSLGMSRSSRVCTVEALRTQVGAMLTRAGGALLESYIEGDEYTVLVSENPDEPGWPLTYTPVRCIFPHGETFKHFELKWKSYESLRWTPCSDGALEEQLRDAAQRIFLGLGCQSYARCDFRVDLRGRVWFLEINTTCGIFYPPGLEGCADIILKAESGGHRAFLSRILTCARRRFTAWEPLFNSVTALVVAGLGLS